MDIRSGNSFVPSSKPPGRHKQLFTKKELEPDDKYREVALKHAVWGLQIYAKKFWNFGRLNTQNRQQIIDARRQLDKLLISDPMGKQTKTLNLFLNTVNRKKFHHNKILQIIKNILAIRCNLERTVNIIPGVLFEGIIYNNKPFMKGKIIFEKTGKVLEFSYKNGKIQQINGKTSEGYDFNANQNANGKFTGTIKAEDWIYTGVFHDDMENVWKLYEKGEVLFLNQDVFAENFSKCSATENKINVSDKALISIELDDLKLSFSKQHGEQRLLKQLFSSIPENLSPEEVKSSYKIIREILDPQNANDFQDQERKEILRLPRDAVLSKEELLAKSEEQFNKLGEAYEVYQYQFESQDKVPKRTSCLQYFFAVIAWINQHIKQCIPTIFKTNKCYFPEMCTKTGSIHNKTPIPSSDDSPIDRKLTDTHDS